MTHFPRKIGLSLEWSCHGIPWLMFVAFWLAMLWRTTPTATIERISGGSTIPTYRTRSWTLSQWLAGPTTSLFPDQWTQAFCLLFALLIDLCVVGLIKMCVRRPRPKDDIAADMRLTVPVDMWSFPSGHATRACLLFWLLPHFFAFSTMGLGLLAFWVVIICFSRFAMRRHHATDILAGAIFGFLEYRLVWMIDWIYVTQRVMETAFSVIHSEL
ncbi:Presqualene diphosphate phosphatase [Fasciola hepatica]|uniref:Presqualene diphosphate phosphatase n=1 Tax=Fasciola hepatica TaxID=6192 RepID=A0A4E0QX30_FASHE|nr:Presqualene diphosphate phosphatase [Fasciola hepatica]